MAFNSDPQKEINFRQTSPVLQRRNIRRFTSVNRRRSRKSLCAEIGKTHALKKYDQFTLNNSCFGGCFCCFVRSILPKGSCLNSTYFEFFTAPSLLLAFLRMGPFIYYIMAFCLVFDSPLPLLYFIMLCFCYIAVPPSPLQGHNVICEWPLMRSYLYDILKG